MSEVLQIIGAIMVLGGFALSQFRVLDQRSYPYLLLNVVGSGVLAVLALASRQWGFVLLEGGWALIALWGVIRRASDHAPVSAH
jgi:hypothetical protein